VKYEYCPKCDDARQIHFYEYCPKYDEDICKVCGSKCSIVDVRRSEFRIASVSMMLAGFIIFLLGVIPMMGSFYSWELAEYQGKMLAGGVIMMLGGLAGAYDSKLGKERALELGRKLQR